MSKKAVLLYILIFIFSSGFIYTQGLGSLAEKTADGILDYFEDKHNVKTSIITFEDTSGVSDLTAQKFYQMVVARLEAAAGNKSQPGFTFAFTDLMINFHKNRGQFNLNRIHLLNYLIYIKLTRNKNKIGAGISIFSRIGDRIVYVKYIEDVFTAPEREIFNATLFGFKAAGFSKIIEIDAKRELLDFKSVPDQRGRLRFLFYYPGKIEFFGLNGNRLSKFFTYKLQWGRPYYPVMEYEGTLACFLENGIFYVAVGANFSKISKFLAFKNDRWDEIDKEKDEGAVDFVPFKWIELNGIAYLAGARYALGKNYFENKLILIPFQEGQFMIKSDTYLEKEVPPFYSLDFSTGQNTKVLSSVHLIDRDYKYRFLSDNFQQLTVEEEGERGGALCTLDGQWLAVSDFSRGSDRLYFYKIEAGSRRLVFQNNIDGEIVFISGGQWQTARGFWVYVKKQTTKTKPGINNKTGAEYVEYSLQFWSKKSDLSKETGD